MRSSFVPVTLYAVVLAAGGAYTYHNPVCWASTLKYYHEHTTLFAAVAVVLAAVGYALMPSLIDEGRVGGVSGVLNHKNTYLDRPNIESVVEEFYDFYGNDTRQVSMLPLFRSPSSLRFSRVVLIMRPRSLSVRRSTLLWLTTSTTW